MRRTWRHSLAWLLTEQGKSLDLALWLAERAARLSPSNPAIIDTLGWLYRLNGQVDVAVRNLRIAATALPDEPTVLYHLAAALADQGAHEESVDLLRQLLADSDFPEREDARALLDSLADKMATSPSK